MPPSDTPIHPENTLEACRNIGFAEGAWIYDVRAGHCQIMTLSESTVVLATDSGQPIVINADELLTGYRNDSLRLEGEQ